MCRSDIVPVSGVALKSPGSFLSVFSREVNLYPIKKQGLELLNEETQCAERNKWEEDRERAKERETKVTQKSSEMPDSS